MEINAQLYYDGTLWMCVEYKWLLFFCSSAYICKQLIRVRHIGLLLRFLLFITDFQYIILDGFFRSFASSYTYIHAFTCTYVYNLNLYIYCWCLYFCCQSRIIHNCVPKMPVDQYMDAQFGCRAGI